MFGAMRVLIVVVCRYLFSTFYFPLNQKSLKRVIYSSSSSNGFIYSTRQQQLVVKNILFWPRPAAFCAVNVEHRQTSSWRLLYRVAPSLSTSNTYMSRTVPLLYIWLYVRIIAEQYAAVMQHGAPRNQPAQNKWGSSDSP